MTSKCTLSAPAASTVSTSSARRAKSADKIDAAIHCIGASLAHTPPSANELVGGLNLLRTLLRTLEHRFGQAVGPQLIRMMPAHLSAVALDDLLIRHHGLGQQHRIGLRDALLADRPAICTAASATRA